MTGYEQNHNPIQNIIMSELLNKLREESAKAHAAKSREVLKTERKKQLEHEALEYDLQKADTLIRDLPPLLERAAKAGYRTMDILQLDKLVNCTQFDADVMLREYDLHGITSENLLGGAFKVAEWLNGQGLLIYIRQKRNTDDSQGRSWSELILCASWEEK